MKFAAEVIEETLDVMCANPAGVAADIIAALAAEGYQITAGVAPATGGGHKVEIKPPKVTNKSRTQGDPKPTA